MLWLLITEVNVWVMRSWFFRIPLWLYLLNLDIQLPIYFFWSLLRIKKMGRLTFILVSFMFMGCTFDGLWRYLHLSVICFMTNNLNYRSLMFTSVEFFFVGPWATSALIFPLSCFDDFWIYEESFAYHLLDVTSTFTWYLRDISLTTSVTISWHLFRDLWHMISMYNCWFSDSLGFSFCSS